MTQGKEKKKTSVKNDKHEHKKTEERGRGKSASCSDSLKANSAGEEQKRADNRGRPDEQPEGDNIHELPSYLILTVHRHEGETCDGQFHREGFAYFEGGHTYKGMFSKGLMDGQGVFTRADGLKYEGDFVRNMPMGKGTYNWPDGSSYEGEVYNGVRHGTGTYTCAKNSVSYSGQWDQGKRHGKGAVYYNQEKTSWYKGDWVKNIREGWGVRCYPSGDTYSGEWKNNLRHGEGTMNWVKLRQQYAGMWQNGVQHGRGTHVWILERTDGSQYSQSNKYTGDFEQGQRHGQGTFHYAGGAIYEGEWRNNKKHGKVLCFGEEQRPTVLPTRSSSSCTQSESIPLEGKFTFKDGHVFEGEFVDDQTMTHNMNGNSILTPLCGAFPPSGGHSSVLGSDMALNIQCLLDLIPEGKRNTERKQVEFAILREGMMLRSVYGFYSRLGRTKLPDNIFLLSRLQLWRLLKDCNIHHHNITLTQIDRLIREGATTAEVHSPFTPMLLRKLISCLVVVAYHIYHKDMASQKNILASCFSKLMSDNILPNAKNVKGFLFRHPDCAEVALNYSEKCWKVYQAYCKINAANGCDESMTCRQLLWMFKDLHLLDNKLTIARLLNIITAESLDPSNLSSCLDLEITFLEFFEVLLGSAEVKCHQVSESLEEGQSLSSPESTREHSQKTLQTKNNPSQLVAASSDSPVNPDISSHKSEETEESCDTAESSTAPDGESQQHIKTEVHDRPESAECTEEQEDVQTREKETKGREAALWIQTIHQFFNHFFLPAFEHNQAVSRNVKEEKLRQEAQRRIALAKAQQRAR